MDLVPREYKKESSISGALPGSGFSFENNSLQVASKLLNFGTKTAWTVLVVFILAWAGLFFYNRTIPGQITALKNKQAQIFGQSEKETADKILALQNGIELLQGTLRSHVYTSELLNKVSELTLDQVQWQSFSLDSKEKKLKMIGLAASFSEAGKQIMVLQENFPQVTVADVELAQTGGVTFAAEMSFDSKYLQKESF